MIAPVFSKETVHRDLVDQARQMMGDRRADIVNSLLSNAQKPSSGFLAIVIAFLTLLFSASGVFIELRDALNTIWDVKSQANAGWKGMIKERLFSFGIVLSIVGSAYGAAGSLIALMCGSATQRRSSFSARNLPAFIGPPHVRKPQATPQRQSATATTR